MESMGLCKSQRDLVKAKMISSCNNKLIYFSLTFQDRGSPFPEPITPAPLSTPSMSCLSVALTFALTLIIISSPEGKWAFEIATQRGASG